MSMYDDKSLLFITSTDGRIPQGRNARAQHRTETASKAVPAKGSFGTIDLRPADEAEGKHSRKRQRRTNTSHGQSNYLVNGPVTDTLEPCQRDKLPRSLTTDWALFINPTEILSVATFHVRRMAVVSMRSDPEEVANVLRRRQWSCVPFAHNCFGKDPCVDIAIMCVADRIRFLSGSPFSPLSMMKHYEKALRHLQTALDEPAKHHPQDILAAVQLLAVYEMLDSLDNDSWSKHVAGAATMIRTYTTITPEALAKWESRGCGHALPMFGDALMKGDATFFRTYPWRELLWAIFEKLPDPPEGILDLMQCLRLLPSLLLDVDAAVSSNDGIDNELNFALLDRAHDIQYRMRNALGGNQLYTHCNYRELLTNFDFLGTFLAGLVATDRMIAALRPKAIMFEQDATEELCTQLLQLELGASAQYPPAEILAGFQHAGALGNDLHTHLSTNG